MSDEKPAAKLCPMCGKRAPVKAKDRQRSLRALRGWVTLTRNDHSCEWCHHGFYPLDRTLDLPEDESSPRRWRSGGSTSP